MNTIFRNVKMKALFKNHVFGWLYLGICLLFFFLVFKLRITTDIQTHIGILKTHLKFNDFPNPPLYYGFVYLFDLVIISGLQFVIASILVLSIVSLWKFYIVKKYISKDVPHCNYLLAGMLAFSLMFCSPIYLSFVDKNVAYLGKFTGTIWHNSTIIFAFPFCIWLFFASVRFLKSPTILLAIQLFGLSILILLSKPSFLFPFIVVYPIVTLYCFGWRNKWFFGAISLSLLIFYSLLIQKKIIYQNGQLDRLIYGGEKSDVILAPFQVWLSWTQNPIMSILSSFLFIGASLLLNWKEHKKNIEVTYAAGLMIIAILIFFLFAESGQRFYHGNFYWQIPITVLLMNMVLLKSLLLPVLQVKFHKSAFYKMPGRNKWLLFFYFLHVFSGFYYLARILLEKTYS